MEKLDWTSFSKRVSIKAEANAIFDYWTNQENIERWFLSKAAFTSKDNGQRDRLSTIVKGDSYVWMWHGSDNVAEGEILENNNKDFLQFTFLGCVVSLEIKMEDGENIVELIQSQIPLDEVSRMSYYVGCSRGWTFYLANLKSILEGGIDLRNRNKNLEDMLNT